MRMNVCRTCAIYCYSRQALIYNHVVTTCPLFHGLVLYFFTHLRKSVRIGRRTRSQIMCYFLVFLFWVISVHDFCSSGSMEVMMMDILKVMHICSSVSRDSLQSFLDTIISYFLSTYFVLRQLLATRKQEQKIMMMTIISTGNLMWLIAGHAKVT